MLEKGELELMDRIPSTNQHGRLWRVHGCADSGFQGFEARFGEGSDGIQQAE